MRINSLSLKPNKLTLRVILMPLSPRPLPTPTTRTAPSPSPKTGKAPNNTSSPSFTQLSHLMSTRNHIKLWESFRQFLLFILHSKGRNKLWFIILPSSFLCRRSFIRVRSCCLCCFEHSAYFIFSFVYLFKHFFTRHI